MQNGRTQASTVYGTKQYVQIIRIGPATVSPEISFTLRGHDVQNEMATQPLLT